MADVALRVASSSERAYGEAREFDVWCAFAGSDLRARPYTGPVVAAAVEGGTVIGVASATLGDVTGASDGTVETAALIGVAATTLDAMAVASAGQVQLAGIAATTLGALSGASTGGVRLAGVTATTLGDVIGASAGGVRLAGLAATTLGDVVSSAVGTVTGIPRTLLPTQASAAFGGFRAGGRFRIQRG